MAKAQVQWHDPEVIRLRAVIMDLEREIAELRAQLALVSLREYARPER